MSTDEQIKDIEAAMNVGAEEVSDAVKKAQVFAGIATLRDVILYCYIDGKPYTKKRSDYCEVVALLNKALKRLPY